MNGSRAKLVAWLLGFLGIAGGLAMIAMGIWRAALRGTIGSLDFAWFIWGCIVGMVSLLELRIVSMQKGYAPPVLASERG